MHSPPLRGRCAWRALFAWKLDPAFARRMVPAPLRPKLWHGAALGAVDTMGLQGLRPRLVPGPLGLSMAMATHLIAVQWEVEGAWRDALFVLRRDVDVRGLGRAGGLLLPGRTCGARIRVYRDATAIEVESQSSDGKSQLHLVGRSLPQWPDRGLFASGRALMDVLGNRSGGMLAFDEAGRGALVHLDAKPELAEPLAMEVCESNLFGPARGVAEPEAAVLLKDLVCVWTPKGKVLRASPANSAKKIAEERSGEGIQEPSPA